MLFESIHAHRFGPFRDGVLDFTPGLNIVHGPNESGKSSWHAALFLGLCGLRRRRGPAGDLEKLLTLRHRPWDDADWSVVVQLQLDDGRRVEISRDLAGNVACRATDMDLGRDYTREIIHQGSPDGARWLGLDRHSFLVTACVRQGDLLEVLRRPEVLQRHLQCLAGNSKGDSTAAEALERIDQFRRECIGSNRIHSNRPLRRAVERVEAARDKLAQVQAEREVFSNLLERADELREREGEAQRDLRRCRAALDFRACERERLRLERARELLSRFPDGEPQHDAAQEILERDAAAVLRDKNALEGDGSARTSALELDGSAAPGDELAERGPAAEVDTRDDVLDAHEAFLRSRQAVELHDDQRPPREGGDSVVFVAAAVAVVTLVAAILLPESRRFLGLSLALIGGASALLGLAWSVAESRQIRRQLRIWQGVHMDLEAELDGVARRLEDLLVARAVLPQPVAVEESTESEDLDHAVEEYRSERRRRRRGMFERIREREIARRTETELRRRRKEIDVRLREQARRCGLRETTSEGRALALRRWLEGRANASAQRERAQREWGELLAILDDAPTVAVLADEVASREEELRVRVGEFSSAEIAQLAADSGVDEATLRDTRERARQVTTELAELLGRLQERERTAGDAAAAEEELAAAEEELGRLRDLDDTLSIARDLLEKASRRIHRDLAPALAASVRRHLESLSQGRYVDVRVDPESLAVQVRERAGVWRDATVLSHGTSEQIYLLLRAALVDALTHGRETCPLLLDDALVNFDHDRKRAAFGVLHSLSHDRQVILFTQDDAVLEWAEDLGERDCIIQLEREALLASV